MIKLRGIILLAMMLVCTPALAQVTPGTSPLSIAKGGTNAGTVAGARASGGLNIDEQTSHGDSNYPITATDRNVATSATLTAARTWTLPTAASVNAGQHLYVYDSNGFVSSTNTLTIQRNGSDTINGLTASKIINTSNSGFMFVSDGVSNWSAQAIGLNGSVTPTGATTARSLPNLFGDFLTVKDFGVTGTADDTTVFQAAIDASCPGHLSGLVNQIFPVLIPTGIYNISQLNATNCAGFTMAGMGASTGSNGGVILRKTVGTSINAILDLTGSIAGANLKNFFIQGSLTDGDIPYAQEGILMANSSLTSGTGNVNLIENVAISGRFSIAGIYMYGVCCSVATQLTGQNANPSNANATGWSYLNTNVNSVTSTFATIATGAQGASGFSCYRCEMHAFTGSSGASGRALALDGSRDFLYSGGILASANAAYTTVLSGNTTQLTFENTQWYTDQGPTSPFAVGSSAGTVKNLVFINPDVTVGSGGGLTSLTGFTSGRVIDGIININGTVNNFHTGGLGASPAATSCGVSPTVTGTDTDGTVTEGGAAVSGCTITFAVPFTAAPSCAVTDNLGVATFQTGATATVLTIANTSSTNLKVSWICHGP